MRAMFLSKIAICVLSFIVLPALAAPLTSGFTYQGQLAENGQPADGIYDFQLALFDQDAGGSALDVNVFEDIAVSNGVFRLMPDFTAEPFEAGLAYWVEARVRPGADTGTFTALMPRQAITASPYALVAQAVLAPLNVPGDATVQGGLTVSGDIVTGSEVRAGRLEADEIWSDGAVDLLGGVAIQRGGDTVALVVGNDGPTQPAVRVMGDLEVRSLSCDGTTRCVGQQTLSFPSYASPDDLLIETESRSIGAGSIGQVTARCAATDQILVLWDCPSGGVSSLVMIGTELVGIENSGVAMGIQCQYENRSVNLSDIAEARAMCVALSP